ncbi:MAG TPA: hypothetical protein VFM40_01995 [Actinomycetota bacterium]|nr:hypothetical protein [Actinomycetota bacterium]
MSQTAEETVRRDRRVELIAAVMLSIATVVTAWSAYQATRWSGDQAENYTSASATRTESVRSSTEANRQVLIDVDTFLGWLNARQTGDRALADEIHARMREEFLPAFDAWLAMAPRGSIPDGTPFALPEYRLASIEKAERLEAQAAVLFDEGTEANQIGDNFVLAAVLFASVLFFAGLAGTFDSVRAQVFLLALGGLMLVIGTIVVVTLPQDVGL